MDGMLCKWYDTCLSPIAVATSTSPSHIYPHTDTSHRTRRSEQNHALALSTSTRRCMHCIHLTFFCSSLIALFSRFFVSLLFLLINLVKELFLREIVQWNSVLVVNVHYVHMIPNNNKWDFFCCFCYSREYGQSCSHQSYMETIMMRKEVSFKIYVYSDFINN